MRHACRVAATCVALLVPLGLVPRLLGQGQQGQPARMPVVEIAEPGSTGLSPGRYRVRVEPASGDTSSARLTLTLLPSNRERRYAARATGCEDTEMAINVWFHTITSTSNGALRLVLTSGTRSRCRLEATIPAAVPGIQGTPIGTAGAPQQRPVPGIEGSPIGTAGAPSAPTRTPAPPAGSADDEFRRLMARARAILPELACGRDRRSPVPRPLAPVRTALEAVAASSTPAAAVQPHRRLRAEVGRLEDALERDRASAVAATRCADGARACAAAGGVGEGCVIEEARCLALVVCGQSR